VLKEGGREEGREGGREGRRFQSSDYLVKKRKDRKKCLLLLDFLFFRRRRRLGECEDFEKWREESKAGREGGREGGERREKAPLSRRMKRRPRLFVCFFPFSKFLRVYV